MTPVQAATFHALMKNMLDNAIKGMGQSDCMENFKRDIVTHATENSEYCTTNLLIFSSAEARRLIDFACNTLFRHYLLYQYCLSSEMQVESQVFVEHVERPFRPPKDLTEGVITTKAEQKERDRKSSKVTPPPEEAKDPEFDEAAQKAADEEAAMADEEQLIADAVEKKLAETRMQLQAKLEEREAKMRHKLSLKA